MNSAHRADDKEDGTSKEPLFVPLLLQRDSLERS